MQQRVRGIDTLAQTGVIAEKIAVIAGEDDDRVLPNSRTLQAIDDTPHRLIDLVNHRVGVALHDAPLLSSQRRHVGAGIRQRRSRRGLAIGIKGYLYVDTLELPDHVIGRRERVMRVGETDKREERGLA